MNNYHQIIYLGDIDHFNLFKEKYKNNELLKYVSIIRCDQDLINHEQWATDYKNPYLSNILFIYQENFPLLFSARYFLSQLFWDKEENKPAYFSRFSGIYKSDKNAYTVESAFSVELYFNKIEEKKYSRFSIMEIE